MSDSMLDLERDIEQSRARLDLTIDRLQNRLTVSGVVDDALGAVRTSAYAPVFDNVLTTLRRNPVPVMLVAAGMALIFYRMAAPPRARRVRVTVHEPLAPDLATPDLTPEPVSVGPARPTLEPLGPDLDLPPDRY